MLLLRGEFLDAARFADFARVEIAFGIHKRDMEQHEGAAFASRMSDSLHDLSGLAIQLPHRRVRDIRNEYVFLLRIGREID
jgi:hypothetical protein